MIEVGSLVKVLRDIVEPSDECNPAYVCAYRDEILVVRRVSNVVTDMPYSVSHIDRPDSSFCVSSNEIELL